MRLLDIVFGVFILMAGAGMLVTSAILTRRAVKHALQQIADAVLAEETADD
jgi:Flp pilus assembly protein TadG